MIDGGTAGRTGRTGAHRRWPGLGAALLAGLLVVACGTEPDATPPRAPAGTEPVPTAPATVAPDALLDVSALRDRIVLGYDMREQPMLDEREVSLGEWRGPCGAPLDTPWLPGGAVGVYRSAIVLVVEAVADPGVGEAQALLQQVGADLQEGCPPFTDVGAGGGEVTVTLTEVIDVGGVGDEALAWRQVVTGDARERERLTVVARQGGRVLVLQLRDVASPSPIPAGDLRSLAELASDSALA